MRPSKRLFLFTSIGVAMLFMADVLVYYYFPLFLQQETSIVPPESLTKGLILYMPFNNLSLYTPSKTYDLSGKRNHGSVIGPQWNSSEGPFHDGAFEFKGKDKITIPDSPLLSPAIWDGFSVALWVKFDKTSFVGEGSGKDYIHFLGKGGNGNDYEYMFRQYNSSNAEKRPDRISFYMFNISGGLGVSADLDEPIPKNEWIFLVGVYNGTSVEIWKNGILKHQAPLSLYGINLQKGTAPLNLGTSDGDSYFTGSMDNVMVYRRALNQSEIRSLYLWRPQ
ncbi:LamG domain-containing protein [Candidatus Pacearchaeota archaeon]|nr:LamG domain-containing protein [Candidatus Pacearchaeota archaeon]